LLDLIEAKRHPRIPLVCQQFADPPVLAAPKRRSSAGRPTSHVQGGYHGLRDGRNQVFGLYARMIQALAQEMHDAAKQWPDTADSNDFVSSVREPEVVKSWTKEQIAELKRTVDNPTVRTMLNLVAERQGDWVALGEIEERLARSSEGIRADLAGLTRLCYKRFGKKGPNTDVWPLYIDWRESADSVTRYRMPEEISQWWLEARIDRQQTMRSRIEEFLQTEQGMVFDFSQSWYASWTLPEYAVPHLGPSPK